MGGVVLGGIEHLQGVVVAPRVEAGEPLELRSGLDQLMAALALR